MASQAVLSLLPMFPKSSPPSSEDDPTEKIAEKVNDFVLFGYCLIIGMAVSATGIVGSIFYGLALKVSCAKPACACAVSAAVCWFFGEIFISYGKAWGDTKKVNEFVLFGQYLIRGMAVSAAGIVGSIFYGLALKVSCVKPACACAVSAAVCWFFGEIFIARGKAWHQQDRDPNDIQERLRTSIALYQKPGLRNEGDTCFINGSLQGLFALPSYRQALLDTAQKEYFYYTAWIKLYKAIFLKEGEEPTEWTNEEIKGILICLARKPDIELKLEEVTQLELKAFEKLKEQGLEGVEEKETTEQDKIEAKEEIQRRIQGRKICLRDCLVNGKLLGTLFSENLENFQKADREDEHWPDVPLDLSVFLIQAIHAFRTDPISRKYFKKLYTHHETYQKSFNALQQVIENYEKREKLLQGDVDSLDSKQVKTPGDIRLEYLRNFLSFSSWRQEDAEEFITRLLGHVRKCEYPGLFILAEAITYLERFETEDPEIQADVKRERGEKNRIETLPINQTISRQLPSSLIQVTFPMGKEKTGQDALNEWMVSIQPENERSKNLIFYAEGDYFIAREEHVLQNFPDNLIVSVGRFAYNKKKETREKINTSLPFGEILLIQGQKYRVVAITIHHNTHAKGGHYTALVRDKISNQWWHCDDSTVFSVNAESNAFKKAFNEGYLYFLEKISEYSTESS